MKRVRHALVFSVGLVGVLGCSDPADSERSSGAGGSGGSSGSSGSSTGGHGANTVQAAICPEESCKPDCSGRCGGPDGCGSVCPSTCGSGTCAAPSYAVCSTVCGSSCPASAGSHPRLGITKETLPALRERLSHAEGFQAWVDAQDAVVPNISDPLHGARNFAFLALTHPVPNIQYGHTQAEYYEAAGQCVDTIAAQDWDDLQAFLLALAYDWAYDGLTAERRAAAVAYFKQSSSNADSNPFHHRRGGYRLAHVMGGLAYAGDGADDADAIARYQSYDQIIAGPNGVKTAGAWLAGNDGGYSAGMGYSVMNFADAIANDDALTHWAYESALSTDAISGYGALEYWPQWIAYSLLPHPTGGAWHAFRTQQDNGPISAFNSLYGHRVALSWNRELYRSRNPEMAALSQYLLDNRTDPVPNDGSTLGMTEALVTNFITLPEMSAKGPQELGLPLSKHFDNLGWVILRSGWDDPGDTHVAMVGEPFIRSASGYASMPPGMFTINRRGPLAIYAGAGVHHAYMDDFGANTLIFPDPDETPTGDLGGARPAWAYPDIAGIGEFTPGSATDIGGIKRTDLSACEGAAHDYDYVYADLTRGYNGPANIDGISSSKVVNFERHLVWFRATTPGKDSDRIVVFDRTETTESRFEKRWLFHPPGRSDGARSFSIDASGSSPGPNRNGSADGKTTHSDPTLVTVTSTDQDAAGKLFWTPILPASRRLVEVGGPNAAGEFAKPDSHEFEDPYGRQMIEAGSYPIEQAMWVGQWTLELSPVAPASTENFLNVLEASELDQTSPTPARAIHGNQLSGVQVGNRIALFATLSKIQVTSDEITIPEAGTYSLLFADLEPARAYTLSVAGSTTSGTATAAGTWYVTITTSSANAVLELT